MPNTHSKRRRRKNADWYIGKIVLLISIIIAGIFAWSVLSLNMLPLKYAVLFVAVLLVLVILVALLTWNPRHRAAFIVGLVFSLIVCIVLIIGTVYVSKTKSTAKNVTTVGKEVAAVSVYVRADDTSDYDSVAAQYTHGILSVQDRVNTDKALGILGEEYGAEISTKEFSELAQLADGLLNSEVDAVVMNRAYISVLKEMEGYKDIEDKIKEVKVINVEQEVKEPSDSTADDLISDSEGKTFTVFISGIDTRGTEMIESSRSDVNIIATINTETKQVLLLSTPRDYYIPLSISNGAKDKLTHAGIYGVDVCMDTLEMLYGVNIDYYFRVNFSGFEEIINSLGGVNVYSEQSFSTEHYSYTEGYNYMDGAKALEFVRERYSFADGDFQRGRNQLALIQGVLDKMISADMLMNYNSVLDAVEGSFETSIPYDVLSKIVRDQLSGGGSWNIVSYSVSGAGDMQSTYSAGYASVVIPDESTVSTAKELINQVYNGETISKPE
jgi:LCP family protein required for cell wall assembly